MAAAAEAVAGLFSAPESVDPNDLDALGDATAAGSRSRKRKLQRDATTPEQPPPETGRLRLRPKVPVLPKYKGKTVDRKEVFGEDHPAEAGDGEDADDDLDDAVGGADITAGAMDGGIGGGLGISENLEEEYERVLQQTQRELQVLRAPSVEESQQRQEQAQELRRQLDTWGALVELRIHLEASLALTHRLPTGAAAASLRAAQPTSQGEAEVAAAQVRGLLGELLALQRRLAQRRGAPLGPSLQPDEVAPKGQPESEVWAALDQQLQSVLDWELRVADGWKERTRLDVRRSFKVLDQSLATQMQALSEQDPARLRQRCTPPPGRHSVLGESLTSSAAVPAQDTEKAEEEEKAAGSELDIFDDREFYVHLLREVLASGSKSNVGKDDKELQAELQGRRSARKQARAQVERRASKGRKIRYVPIEKLQNFMAPRPRTSADGLDLVASGHGAVDAMLKALFA